MDASAPPNPPIPGMLESLFRSKWGVPVVASLSELRGAKYVTLAGRLGVNRASIVRAVDTLIDAGVVGQNPGYGHPLRPEVVLTELGEQIAPVCIDLVERIHERPIAGIALKKWTMPVLHSVQTGAERFGSIRRDLPTATDRALVLALRDLQGATLVCRKIEDAYPPRAIYYASQGASVFKSLLEEIAAAA